MTFVAFNIFNIPGCGSNYIVNYGPIANTYFFFICGQSINRNEQTRSSATSLYAVTLRRRRRIVIALEHTLIGIPSDLYIYIYIYICIYSREAERPSKGVLHSGYESYTRTNRIGPRC